MNLIYLDLSPAYIPFLVQCTDGTGLKTDPTVDSLIIYEEDGGDGTFSSTQITGSPFDPAKVNTKTGLWGSLVAKSALTSGRWYIALWEMTVDGITTAKVDRYFASNFKDDLSSVVEGTLTKKQVLRVLLAAAAGKTTGSGTATVAFRDVADAKDRISATLSSGNRTAVTLDGTD